MAAVGLLLLAASFVAPVWTTVVVVLAMAMLLIFAGGVTAVVGVKRKRLPPFLLTYAQWSINGLFPLAMVFGRALGMEKDRIRGSFVDVHNQLAQMRAIKVKPEEILLLLPHCLQWSECPHRITTDVNNCRQCGKCVVGDLLALQRTYGFRMAVATGGTLARKIILEYRPKVVVGVACERDLASGIQDVRKIHVVGILNDRPNGPCFNTTLDTTAVEETIRSLI